MRVRERFDETREYVANKKFGWAKAKFREGDPFPGLHVTVSQRKMRQLYDARYLRMLPLNPGKLQEMIQPVAPAMPDFDRISDEAITVWLENNGASCEDMETRDGLIAKAQRHWKKLHEPAPEPAPEPTPQPITEPVIEQPPTATEEQANGIANTDGDSEHSGERVLGPADDGDAKTGDTNVGGQPRRRGRRNHRRDNLQRAGNP
jgi:hypothetical protein